MLGLKFNHVSKRAVCHRNCCLRKTKYVYPVIPAKPTRNRPQTDKNHQIRGEIGLQSVLIWFCRFGVGLCSGRKICQREKFQTCLKDLTPDKLSVVCRLHVGVVSVLSGSVRGRVGFNSATGGIPQSHRPNRHETDKNAIFSMNRPAVGPRQCCWRHRRTSRVHVGVTSGKIRYGIARFETDI